MTPEEMRDVNKRLYNRLVDVKNKDKSFHNVPLLNMVIVGRLQKNALYWDQYQNEITLPVCSIRF
jgi:hypothetical protein